MQRPEDVELPEGWDARQREELHAFAGGLLVAAVAILLMWAIGASMNGWGPVLSIGCPGVALLRVWARRRGWLA